MEGIKPVEQIFTELASLHQIHQIAIGSGDQAHIKVNLFGGANARRLALLNNPKQFGLDMERQLPYFIEKQGAIVGFFKNARLILDGTGKSTFDVTK